MNLKQLFSLLSLLVCSSLAGQTAPTLFPLYRFSTGSATEQAAGGGGLPYTVDNISITWVITTKAGVVNTDTQVVVSSPANPINVVPGTRTIVDATTGTVTEQPVSCGTSICDGCPEQCSGCPECLG